MSENPPKWNPPPIPEQNFYILKHRKPVRCRSMKKWGKWFNRNNRRVRKTYINNFRISTVFLALDHNYSDNGPPILFETMIFNSTNDDVYCVRCSTWREALNNHWAAVCHAEGLYLSKEDQSNVPRT